MALAARHAVPFHGPLLRPRYRLPHPSVRSLGMGSAALFLLLLVDALLHPRAFFDAWTIREVQEIDGGWVPTASRAVNGLTGSTGAVTAWAVVLVVFLLARWWVAALGATTLPIGGAVNYAIGEGLVERTRPHLADLARGSQNVEERSFPSGHVMGAVMLYGFLFVVAGRIRHRVLRQAIRGGSLTVIVLVGPARVWSGAHWPTDVLAAYALGGLLLASLIAAYSRADAAVGHLPLIKAGALPHDESRPHVHALTSLVRFEGDTVAKTYRPGLIPTALYWLAFQAPFPYVGNRAALEAAVQRRNLVRLLTVAWYGGPRVARAHGAYRVGDRIDLVSERIEGHAPTDRAAAKAFLRDLCGRFEAAGLPTWQIDPRQPRALDNLLETADGRYHIVDLESGLVSPMASLRTWGRALRRGLVPFFDEVFFDVTRSYVARERVALRAALGDDGLVELHGTMDAAERAVADWHASEPRLWTRALRAVRTGFAIRTWRGRLAARTAGGRERGLVWIDRAIGTWADEGRISTADAATLRQQVEAPTFQAMLPYLGAHILISVPLRFPFGSVARSLMVIGSLGTATTRLLAGRIDRAAWRLAWSIHSPLVVVLAAVPGVGSFAYLAAKPVRANRLLLRALFDAALLKAPWHLYERIGLRRFIARPRPAAPTAAPRPTGTASPLQASGAWWPEDAAASVA